MRFKSAVLILALVLFVCLVPLTVMAANNAGADLQKTATMVTTSSVPIDRASPAIDLTNGGTFTNTGPAQSLNITNTIAVLKNVAMTSTTTLAQCKAGPAITTNSNMVNYFGCSLTNDPATINKASPVSNNVANINCTITAVLNHTAGGAIAYLPSTTIGIVGDNNLVLTSTSVRGNVNRMTAARIEASVVSTSYAADQTDLAATNRSLHRQTTAENSADGSCDANLGGATNSTITVTFGVTNNNSAMT